MKRPLVLLLFIVSAAAGVMPPGTVFAQTSDSVNFGFGGVPGLMNHCDSNVYIFEYEHMLADSKFTVLGRGSEVDYQFDDGIYREEGKPRGVEVGARYYFDGGMTGFFIGGTVGYWTADWTVTSDKGTVNEAQGKGDADSIRANVDMGGRFPLGSSAVSIVPALNIGKYFSSTSCEYTVPALLIGTACSQDTKVQAYIFLSVMVGIGF